MLAAILALAILAVFIALSTLAMVLMARFTLGRRSADTRILIAGASGPACVIAPFLIYFSVTDGLTHPDTLILVAASCVGFVLVGWPVSYLATRRLDRLTRPDVSMFE
jgi:hypothetical protein